MDRQMDCRCGLAQCLRRDACRRDGQAPHRPAGQGRLPADCPGAEPQCLILQAAISLHESALSLALLCGLGYAADLRLALSLAQIQWEYPTAIRRRSPCRPAVGERSSLFQ
jgi:hypothetical protein